MYLTLLIAGTMTCIVVLVVAAVRLSSRLSIYDDDYEGSDAFHRSIQDWGRGLERE